MTTQKYLGYKAIGELFGVSAATVSKWRSRYEGTDHPCPKPDIWIDDTPGWSSAGAWQAWKLGLPGRGTGGGPLPLERARKEYQEAKQAVQEQHPNGKVRHLELRVLARIAEQYSIDRDAISALAVEIMDQNPTLSNEECDIITVATVIRNTRKSRAA
ncbi:hypothetical protein ACWDSF_06445 [Nocardia beijingensis]